MKKPLMLIFVLTCLFARPTRCQAQVGGNVGYSQASGKFRAVQNERNKRVLTKEELPAFRNIMFVEANVLMNMRADEYVAVFGISQEGDTVADCGRKMDATINQFSGELKILGIGGDDLFVDFIAQNKVYGFEASGEVAREKLVGFELKKNVSIHYKDKSLLDKMVVAASRSQIFDLIKVDYIVSNSSQIQIRLKEEASRIIRHKASQYEKLLDIKLLPPGQVYAEKPATYFPQELYDSYTAFETEQIGVPVNRQNLTTQSARKSRTFYFNGLNGSNFDVVINPVVTEPVVQFTLYLKVNYEVAPIKAK
jgi:uncharacterized protein YggE